MNMTTTRMMMMSTKTKTNYRDVLYRWELIQSSSVHRPTSRNSNSVISSDNNNTIDNNNTGRNDNNNNNNNPYCVKRDDTNDTVTTITIFTF